jgi:hypothetical protein
MKPLLRLCLLGLFVLRLIAAAENPRTASLVLDASPGRATQHGAEKLRAALQARGWTVQTAASPEAATGQWLVVAGLCTGDGAPARLLRDASVSVAAIPEALAEKKFTWHGKPALLLGGADDRGLMYAELDAAERIGWAPSPADPYSEIRDVSEQPAIRDRSLSVYTMQRAYWESRFYNEDYWTRYLDMLAANRFNKFLIVFGYENGGFMMPCYPYFFDTPGFPSVHMNDLTPEQQQKNFAALNRLIDQSHARGIAVAVGIWDHIFRPGVQMKDIDWAEAHGNRLDEIPSSVVGITGENLNAYTMASIKKFLESFAVDEVQFRTHEESGLKTEEIEGFWRNVFTMAHQTRPNLLFEARGKGVPDAVINAALDLGVNLRVETKYWMEQMGLPFPPTHVNQHNQTDRRAGYADFLRYPQRYEMNWNLWNGGTTRLLLWADPDYVRRYSAAASLYHSLNWNVHEPLATKMESQHPAAAPFDIIPPRYRYYTYEFERYWHFYQVWGRLGYNPATPTEVWDRDFAHRFGPEAAPHVEAGLHRASQVLPYLVASSVYPYGNFPTTVGWAERQTLGDTLARYATNTGSDVQQFESLPEAAQRIITSKTPVQRTPESVSRWFDLAAEDISREADLAEKGIGAKRGNEFDSTLTDLRILAGLARFHARRALAAVHYNLYRGTGELHELYDAIAGERAALAAWRTIVTAAGDRYSFDLMFGIRSRGLAGHWRDELPVLEKSVAGLEQELRSADPARVRGGLAFVPVFKAAPGRDFPVRATAAPGEKLTLRVTSNPDAAPLLMEEPAPGLYHAIVPASLVRPGLRLSVRVDQGNTTISSAFSPIVSADNEPPQVVHTPIVGAPPLQPLRIAARVTDPSGVKSVRLRYRHVTQFEDYATLDMTSTGESGVFAVTVPGDFIIPKWDFMYFIEATDNAGNGTMWPDLAKEQPYVIVPLSR